MNNPFSLKDKRIVITGASSGIGEQCAISCSQMGAKVVLIGRNEERLKYVYSNLIGEGHLYYSFDITNYIDICNIIDDIVNKIGKVSGFIHSAGIEITKSIKSMKPSDYEKLFSVNVISGFEFTKELIKKKNADDKQSIVFISSVMGLVANAGLTAYCASKGAILSGIKSMAIELAPRNIRVNSISPGHIRTEMMIQAELNMSDNEISKLYDCYLLGLGDKSDVANACIYLLSDASKWVTGTNLIVDGGYSVR